MDSSGFLELLRALTHLSSTQLERAQQHIQHHLQADLLRQSFSEHHAAYFGLSGHLFRFHPARRFGVIRPA